MYSVLTFSPKYPNSYWLKYDWDKNPDYLKFLGNRRITQKSNVRLRLDEKASVEKFRNYDVVLSDAVKLISKNLKQVFDDIAPKDIQIIPAQVYQGSKNIGEYYIPIVLNVIDCIDKKKSGYDKEVEDFKSVYFKPDSLGAHHLAIAKGWDNDHFVITDELRSACVKAKIKGLTIIAEPYNNPLYSED